MEIKNLKIPQVFSLQPKIYDDERGFFLETFRKELAKKIGITDLVQQNQSRSIKGVLRGLHYQEENPQGKLVRCSNGEIFDVAVDIRKGSQYFGQWVGEYLNDKSHKQLWIPPGFAHGFLVISDIADVCYSCTEYYSPNSEKGIIWNDKDLNINWPLSKIDIGIKLSKKDSELNYLKDQIDSLMKHRKESQLALSIVHTPHNVVIPDNFDKEKIITYSLVLMKANRCLRNLPALCPFPVKVNSQWIFIMEGFQFFSLQDLGKLAQVNKEFRDAFSLIRKNDGIQILIRSNQYRLAN